MAKLFEEIVDTVLKEYDIKVSNDEHVKNAMDAMSANLESQDNPKVGIFWYYKFL